MMLNGHSTRRHIVLGDRRARFTAWERAWPSSCLRSDILRANSVMAVKHGDLNGRNSGPRSPFIESGFQSEWYPSNRSESPRISRGGGAVGMIGPVDLAGSASEARMAPPVNSSPREGRCHKGGQGHDELGTENITWIWCTCENVEGI